jgi:hypothetical protein
MKNEAKWDPEKKKGTYGSNIHHGEVVLGTKIEDGGVPECSQDLAAKKGVMGAQQILKDTYERIKANR